MRGLLIIAELTIREARRRRIVWAAFYLGLAFIALYSIGFYFIVREIRLYGHGIDLALDTGFSFVVMAGFYVVSFLGVMLAVLMSVGTLSGEISSHTIQTLATKPIRRSVIIGGKWLGLSAMLVSYVIFLAGGVLLGTWAISHYMPPRAMTGILLIAFQATVMLTLTLLGGTRLSTVTNGVLAFMMYGLAFIGGWIEQIGSFAHNETAVDIGILSSLLVPSEAMWKMASYIMQPPATRGLGLSPFSLASAPSPAMLIYAFVYCAGGLALAIYSFDRRDL